MLLTASSWLQAGAVRKQDSRGDQQALGERPQHLRINDDAGHCPVAQISMNGILRNRCCDLNGIRLRPDFFSLLDLQAVHRDLQLSVIDFN